MEKTGEKRIDEGNIKRGGLKPPPSVAKPEWKIVGTKPPQSQTQKIDTTKK